jgi:integrase
MNEVEAVKDSNDIGLVERTLLKFFGERERDIWVFGINTALRISDLLNIRFDDIEGDTLPLREAKTGKQRTIKLNEKALKIVERRRSLGDEYLFQANSRNVKTAKPVSRQYAARALKDVGDHLGLNLSTHSMRKTRGYHLHKAGTSIELICKMLNHSSPAVTLRYIGITQEDIDQTYTDLVL